MYSLDINSIKNELLYLSYSFTLNDISNRFITNELDFCEICRSIGDDPNFISTFDNENEGEILIGKNSLYDWFIKLNVKLATSKIHTLTESQLLSQMNSLRLNGIWKSVPTEYITFGQDLGLICYLAEQDMYIFPVSYLMSFLSNSAISVAREYLLERNFYDGMNPQFERLILERLQTSLEYLKTKQRYVLLRRQGILGAENTTLEVIGKQLRVTRERVRQIEEKCWKRIHHPSFRLKLVPLLLMFVLNNRGTILVHSLKMQSEIEFICKGLSIPLWKFPHTNIKIIGKLAQNISIPEDIWIDLPDIKLKLYDFLSSLGLYCTSGDAERLAGLLVPVISKRLRKQQKAYLALKKIGRPAHFSEVREIYMKMFNDEQPTEHSIHALLLSEKYGIVWIGSKGTFALEEWGYERPPISIHDAVAEIVIHRYESTGNPVKYTVIEAEIGKYRKYVNPNSIIIAAYCNPKLNNVYGDYFIPKDTNIEIVDEDNVLDQILRAFEEKTKREGYSGK